MNIQRNIYVEKIDALPVEEQPVELVERKGIGHPDSICDAIMASGTFAFCGSFETHCLSNEIKPGSPELTDIFSREVMGANDTSAGVGYAPLSETERLVLSAEKFLNAPSFKNSFPEAGDGGQVGRGNRVNGVRSENPSTSL